MHAEDQYPGLRLLVQQGQHPIQALNGPQREVEHHDIGCLLATGQQRLFRVTEVSHDVNLTGLQQQAFEAVAHHRVVVQ